MTYIIIGVVIGLIWVLFGNDGDGINDNKYKLTEFEKWQLTELFRAGRHL